MSMPQTEIRQEAFTHLATVHMPPDITPLQRRILDALVFHAWDDLRTEEAHRISWQDLAGLIGSDSHDMEALQDAADSLARGAAALLAQASIEQDTFRYAFSPAIRQCLHNPAV
jgi:hypothetical protein